MGKGGKGAPKGGKGNKLARMSEEERLRYLQHRADMEEEARRRKQQLIATFMKVSVNFNFFYFFAFILLLSFIE